LSNVPSPAEIRNTKQVIPTDRLVRWAEESGFEVKRSKGGTSHIPCRHKEFRDIRFAIIATSKQLGSQRCFSDALLEIEQRRNAAAATFKKSAEQKIEDAYKDLPDFLSVEHDFEKGVSVIRDRQLPQLGFTLAFCEAHMLENKIHNIIEDYKPQLFELLGRCRGEYDIDTGMDKGEFNGALGHTFYTISAPELPPYRAGEDSAKLFKHLYDFIQQVMAQDQAHNTRLKSVLENDFVGEIKTAFTAVRGERHNYVPVTRPDGSSFTLKFETASNARAFDGTIQRGRITEEELAKVERVLGGIAFAHAHRGPAARAA